MNFICELRKACEETSQARVAKAIGYSAATVNLVLKGSYKGDLNAVEKAFRGAFKAETVTCPVLGEIPSHRCISIQRQPCGASIDNRGLLCQASKAYPHIKGD